MTKRTTTVCAMFVAVMTAACSSRVVDGADSWKGGLDTARAAVAAGEPSTAARAWREAYGDAVRTRRWEPMVAVGDAALEIGRAGDDDPDARQLARQSYLVAVVVAERQRSVDGVLRSAEAFAKLGDRAVAEQTLTIARRLAGSRTEAKARVTAVETAINADVRAEGSPAQETLTP